jgi:uncharacterized repeat protein (TIGR03803 family)
MALVAAGVLACPQIALAQVDVLYGFKAPDAVNPFVSLLLAADGNFYGATYSGGAAERGTIFKAAPDGTVTVLHSFTGDPFNGFTSGDGAYPAGALIQATDGNFYGLTTSGGTSNNGTAFKMTAAGTVTILHSFDSTEGGPLYGALVEGSDGNFYGTTYSGGSGYGRVFKMTPAGVVTTLYAFTGGPGGVGPNAGVILAADGNFYGTTVAGGSADAGTVFKLTPAGVITVLHSFANGPSDGANPQGTIIQATDGNLYGTTYAGGPSGVGTAFKITLAGTYTMLHGFSASADGSTLWASLLEAPDGNFYGTALYGGTSGYGTVFRMTPAGTVTQVHSFSKTDGANPHGTLVKAADGSFYGTAYLGGAFNAGTIFQVTSGGTFTLRHSFTGGPEASRPFAGLIQAADGNLYGTTVSGGTSDMGTAFKMTPAGAVTVLHSFADNGDGRVFGSLMQATDGNFYGTANVIRPGMPSRGLIFRMTPGGIVTDLHDFDSRDGFGLIQASDGNLYGTTINGGESDRGTAFKMTLAGAFTLLHTFGSLDAVFPGGLIEATDGNFYGLATDDSHDTNLGIIFKMTPAGSVTTVHTFSGGAGGTSPSSLIQAPDGNLYGTTGRGGTSDLGTVFRMNLTGSSFTILHSFDGTDGANPDNPLVYASDGNFYGTIPGDGIRGAGKVFRMRPTGSVTVLHSFNFANGAHPYGSLVQSADGTIYGTTSGGGPFGMGVVFRFSIAPPPTVTLTVNRSGSGTGTVTTNPLGINCGASCAKDYTVGTAVTLTAAVSGNSFFAGWSGAGCTGIDPCLLSMTVDQTVTATFSATAFAFTDEPLPQQTQVKAAHFVELRQAINTLRANHGLAAFVFSDPTLASGSTVVKASHLAELRTALDDVYGGLGRPAPTYTDAAITAGLTVIKRVHILELRSAVRALE